MSSLLWSVGIYFFAFVVSMYSLSIPWMCGCILFLWRLNAVVLFARLKNPEIGDVDV